MRAGRKTALAGLAVLAFAGFMTAYAPAHLIHYAPLPAGLSINQPEGTIWSGKTSSVTYSSVQIPDVQWQVNPASLLTGQVEITFQAGGHQEAIMASGTLYLDQTTLTLDNVEGEADLNWLNQQLPRRNRIPAQLGGYAFLNLESLELNQTSCLALDGELTVNKGRINSVFGNLPLGSTEADLSCSGNQVKALFNQSSKQLNANGQLTLSPGRYALSTTIRPSSQMPKSMQQGLAMLGRKSADGSYAVSWNGRW
ncbi:type II secretion system protein N [Parendozoicomonas haliclonae]|uniref:Type II secretion system protein N n=1 Tax=Parendozoicomonas haliclonae TaxID=1960125 RepID=A0A1X7AGE2_9GAMM|nr:type II secretion system protein N [Parendozoicomonas haliclonae]SMA39533.1 Type II secretion system protein N [Parendozoicomonas haliclonae]